MEKIVIVKVDCCKTFGIINVLNIIIPTFVPYQTRWLDGKSNGLEVQGSNLGENFHLIIYGSLL
jgi:hypothetical protein